MDVRILSRESFVSPPDAVARFLLGKTLLRRWRGITLCGRIVETEAYFGLDDPAAHAAAGRTARNIVLWGEPGHAYVYFIYGMHACLNVSCEPDGQAGCVLLRALEPLEGFPEMRALRGLSEDASPRMLTGGPGRLCQAMAITREGLNGVDMLDPASDLLLGEPEPGWIGGEAGAEEIQVTSRIGITKAADRPLRFFLRANPCVSAPRLRRVKEA